MNVLFVIKGNEIYVSQQAQVELAAGLQKRGVNILLSGNFSEEVATHLDELDLKYVTMFPTKAIDKKYTKDFAKLLKERQINLVHFIDGTSARNGIPALKRTNVKSVIYFGSKSLHWYDPSSYFTYLSPQIDAIIGNSNYVYDHVKAQLFGKNKEKAVRIFKGYNPEWFVNTEAKDLSEFGVKKGDMVVVSVGNHRKVKGIKYYLQSSHHLSTDKRVHYFLIGIKTQIPEFQKMKAESPMGDRIHLLGIRNDVMPILKSADVYAQTSLEEGFGRAISEAMSVGKPIVMTDAGGCTELIDKESGMIVPIKDPKAIADAISTLLNDDALRKRMGDKAKERISSVYNIEHTVDGTLALYERLVNS